MVELLDRLVYLTEDPLIRASLLFHAAEILGTKIGDEPSAIDNLLKAFDLAPDYPPTLWRLIDYYWEKDDLDSVMEMAEHLLESREVDGGGADVRHVRMAIALLLIKNDLQAATGLLKRALASDSPLDHAVRDLAHAAIGPEALEKIAALIQAADPAGSLYQFAERLYKERPATPGLTDLLVRLNEDDQSE